MDQAIEADLRAAARAFVEQPGEISVMIQRKGDADPCVAIDADRAMPSASLVKAAIACAAVAANDIDLHRPVAIAELDDTFYCSIIQAFDRSDHITLKALIGLMLIVSDNPATSAVLEAVGMDRVNHWLKQAGLTSTHLAVGFDDAALGTPLRANLTTAQDCLRLLQIIDTAPQYAVVKHMLANNLRNERIPKQLPDDVVIAHKTGTLNGLCHDIAIIESPRAAYRLVILADNLPDHHDFGTAIARFSQEIYELMSA